MIAAGCGDLCDDCYWRGNLGKKYNQNINLFESSFLKKQYGNYTHWLANQVGAKKAALYLNKHTHFFIRSEILWVDSLPDVDQLLRLLRTSGLRKFELVMQWLDEIHDIRVISANKKDSSESDQSRTLIESLPQPSLAFDIVSAYKQKLDEKMRQGKTSTRSVRLAIKPAVALMLSIDQKEQLLPDLKLIKAYLAEYSGQAAALTGFINFLNDQYDTDIDYISIKKSSFIKEVSKKKLEQELLQMMSLDQEIDVVAWVKKGLQFFHNIGYQNTLKIQKEMIIQESDGFNVLFNGKTYWLPKL